MEPELLRNPSNTGLPSLTNRSVSTAHSTTALKARGPEGGNQDTTTRERARHIKVIFFNPKPRNSLPLEIEPGTKKCYSESLAIELNALSQPTITI
jgi:hypothetical protein